MSSTSIPFEKLVAAGGSQLLAGSLALAALYLHRAPRALPVVHAGFLSLMAGYVNLLSNEAQLPAMLVFASALFAGFSRPKSAWRWAPWLALPVPAGEFLKALYNPYTANLTALLMSLTSIAPSLLGVGIGSVARLAGRRICAKRSSV